ncbi:Mu transposase C-terminal domain-containing protein [Undibacterium arcticum]|uniref:Mu transposase C-terminal domain-containing protein n=2 Tax=Undibacterium arcticum TaxID=1762892 RepID=A0ABV7EUK4_9BURK
MTQRSSGDSNVMAKVPGELELIDSTTWTRLALLDAAIRPTLALPFNQAMAEQIAHQLNVHWGTVYRYRQRLLAEGIATALFGRSRGFPSGSSRLSPEQEAIIDKVIGRLARGAAKLRVIDVVEEIAQRCRIENVSTPSRPSIDRRLHRLTPALVVRRKVEDDRQTSTATGTFVVRKPFDVVQIDHTKCDLFVVDDLYRTSIGRPWLSVAMDVATRAVLAILVTFEPPSAAAVALLITRIVNAKTAWLKSLGLGIDWPMGGLPRSLHLDNGAEFHSKALGRDCTQFGIELTYRPPGRPQFGGHIERIIGTLMTKLKKLPGATGHSVKNRKNHAPERTAALTLQEFERWLAIEIGERYHHTEHRGLKGGTPYAAWKVAQPLSRPVKHMDDLYAAFLPAVLRTLHRGGIVFNHIRYWNPLLTPLLATPTKLIVHYDPADISALHVKLPDGSYLKVGYADLRHPAIALWECLATLKYLRTVSRLAINETRLFEAINAQRKIIDDAKNKTRAARKGAARKSAEARSRAIDPTTNNTPQNESPTGIDYSIDAPEYPVEMW